MLRPLSPCFVPVLLVPSCTAPAFSHVCNGFGVRFDTYQHTLSKLMPLFKDLVLDDPGSAFAGNARHPLFAFVCLFVCFVLRVFFFFSYFAETKVGGRVTRVAESVFRSVILSICAASCCTACKDTLSNDDGAVVVFVSAASFNGDGKTSFTPTRYSRAKRRFRIVEIGGGLLDVHNWHLVLRASVPCVPERFSDAGCDWTRFLE